MKRFEKLGKALSKIEQKVISGGYVEPVEKACTTNADCGDKTVKCNGNDTTAIGTCRSGKCYWGSAC